MKIDYTQLSGKLSMSKLLSLEPAGLRRLLKSGLRFGATHSEFTLAIRDDLGLTPESDAAVSLLNHLQDIGWISIHEGRWKTHF